MEYRYALDEDNAIVDIDNVSNDDRRKLFTCGECGERLVPRALDSTLVTAHFYHLQKERACNGESYLHWISKHLLAEALMQKEPFLLRWESHHRCLSTTNSWLHFYYCHKDTVNTIDLSSDFPFLEIEKKDGNFIPDISLRSRDGDKIYIEIFQSSAISDEKRKSGHKIIEIKVAVESDIENITKRRVIEGKSSRISLIGFSCFEEVFDCKGNCQYLKDFMVRQKGAKNEEKIHKPDTFIIKSTRDDNRLARDLKSIASGRVGERAKTTLFEMIPFYNQQNKEREENAAFPHLSKMLKEISAAEYGSFKTIRSTRYLWYVRYRGEHVYIANVGLYYLWYKVEDSQVVPLLKSASFSDLSTLIKANIDKGGADTK